MRQSLFRGSLVLLSLAGLNSTASTSHAGIIPWTYNAIFGHGPIFNGGYQPGWGGGWGATPVFVGGAQPMVMPTTTFYGPAFSQASFGGDCCNPCPCAPCGNGCASGDCGVATPATDTTRRLVPEPNRNEPNPAPRNPETGGWNNTTPERTYTEPPQDEFVPGRLDNSQFAPPRNPTGGDQRSTIPNTQTNPGGSTIPPGQGGSSSPNNFQFDSNRSTVPQGSSGGPGASIPSPGDFGRTTNEVLRPAPNEPSGLELADPPEEFVKPTEENKDSAEPETDGVLELDRPSGVDVQVLPLEIEPSVASSVKVSRQRVQLQSSYRIPAIARRNVAPALPQAEDAQVASK